MNTRLIRKRVLPYYREEKGPLKNIYFIRRMLQWASSKRYYLLTQYCWPHKAPYDSTYKRKTYGNYNKK